MRTKKGQSHFDMSEPECLIEYMNRHKDWAVIVCLVGGGCPSKSESSLNQCIIWIKLFVSEKMSLFVILYSQLVQLLFKFLSLQSVQYIFFFSTWFRVNASLKTVTKGSFPERNTACSSSPSWKWCTRNFIQRKRWEWYCSYNYADW